MASVFCRQDYRSKCADFNKRCIGVFSMKITLKS